MNATKTRKIEFEDAINESLESRDGCKQVIEQLEWIANREQSVSIAKETAKVMKLLAIHALPFRPKPPIVQAWYAQYEPKYHGQSRRFKPLILDGDTRLGKSSWVMSWFDVGSVLALNCQDIETPNMKEYKRARHKCIVFEEASWKLFFQNKLLFQAGPSKVQCGQSATNCMAYDVMVYMTPMVICTNDFYGKIDDAARHYVEQNVFYQHLTEKCYISPDDL